MFEAPAKDPVKEAMVEAIKGFGASHLSKYRTSNSSSRLVQAICKRLCRGSEQVGSSAYLTSTDPASGLRLANRQYTELNAAFDQKLGALKLEVKAITKRCLRN